MCFFTFIAEASITLARDQFVSIREESVGFALRASRLWDDCCQKRPFTSQSDPLHPPYGGEGGGPGCGVTLILIGFRGCGWLMFGGRKIKKTKWDSGWPSSEKSETVVPKIFPETHLHHTIKHKAVWIDGRASDSTLQTSLCYSELIPHFRQSSKFSSLETLPGSEHCFLINIWKTVAFITSRLDCCNSLSRLRLIQKLCCRN